jgi:hypothetical protein
MGSTQSESIQSPNTSIPTTTPSSIPSTPSTPVTPKMNSHKSLVEELHQAELARDRFNKGARFN